MTGSMANTESGQGTAARKSSTEWCCLVMSPAYLVGTGVTTTGGTKGASKSAAVNLCLNGSNTSCSVGSPVCNKLCSVSSLGLELVSLSTPKCSVAEGYLSPTELLLGMYYDTGTDCPALLVEEVEEVLGPTPGKPDTDTPFPSTSLTELVMLLSMGGRRGPVLIGVGVSNACNGSGVCTIFLCTILQT